MIEMKNDKITNWKNIRIKSGFKMLLMFFQNPNIKYFPKYAIEQTRELFGMSLLI